MTGNTKKILKNAATTVSQAITNIHMNGVFLFFEEKNLNTKIMRYWEIMNFLKLELQCEKFQN